mmetsp:Transcript_21660/g.30295  ORF Transcript_21660/g.30295 Transcript_21660/m.30295 type:complete len:266 (-) Transcript_21660:348-1145(-)
MVPYTETNFNGTSMVDWGAFGVKPMARVKGLYGIRALNGDHSRGFAMARTLGSEDPNQVQYTGRKIMFAWLSHDNGNAAVSIGRELSLSSDLVLLQQFVPELKKLRKGVLSLGQDRGSVDPGLYSEVVARFSVWPLDAERGVRGLDDFGLRVLGCEDEGTGVDLSISPSLGLALVNATDYGKDVARAGPLVFNYDPEEELPTSFTIHAVVDASIIEVIVNNQTAIAMSVTNLSSEACTKVSLFGLSPAVTGFAEVYPLKMANQMQ